MSHDETLTETQAWAWATEHGAPERASAEQLLEWLASGELPPQTLVWKPGWGEWLPAMQVAEFAAAFPSVTAGSRRVARAAPEHASEPPPVPVAHYPRLRLLAKDVVGQPVPAPFEGVVPDVGPAPAGGRALRDLDRVQNDLVTSQVPVEAMLAKARAMKRLGDGAGARRADHWQKLDLGTFGEPLPLDRGHVPDSSPPLRTFSPLALELGLPALLEPEPPEERFPWERAWKRYGRWVALGGFIGGVVALMALREQEPVRPAPAATTEPAALRPEIREPRVIGPCRVTSQPVRLDDWALRDVSPLLLSLSEPIESAKTEPEREAPFPAGWLAIGYARSQQAAAGLVLSPESLDFDRHFSTRSTRSISSVTPRMQHAKLDFHVETGSAAMAHARLLDTEPPLRIGMNAQGWVVAAPGAEPVRVWELPRGAVISVPAIAAHPGGFTVAARSGRERGPLFVGVMSERGEPLSELGQIGDASARFGRPALASGKGKTVLAVVARSPDGARQSLWLAGVGAGALPLELEPFAPSDEPVSGARSDLDTPALAPLPGGGFAVAFTQGHGWNRRVRLQLLSPELAPLDAPIDVTVPDRKYRGANAAALHWAKDRLLAFHFIRHAGGDSLWVSSVSCELG